MYLAPFDSLVLRTAEHRFFCIHKNLTEAGTFQSTWHGPRRLAPRPRRVRVGVQQTFCKSKVCVGSRRHGRAAVKHKGRFIGLYLAFQTFTAFECHSARAALSLHSRYGSPLGGPKLVMARFVRNSGNCVGSRVCETLIWPLEPPSGYWLLGTPRWPRSSLS